MNSRLYRGIVWHTRGEPAYRFQYRVWYLCLDLAEIAQVDSKLRLLSIGRHNLTSFWAGDYLALEDDSVTIPRTHRRVQYRLPDPKRGRPKALRHCGLKPAATVLLHRRVPERS